MEFAEFPKIARLTRECVITEKIDGTNASIYINAADGSFLVGSRTRWITPDTYNHGFARWAFEHRDELLTLGDGHHFGEWWGSGVRRGYGLQKGDKRFSLFNVSRWHQAGAEPYISTSGDPRVAPKSSDEAPACCSVVPVLYRGTFTTPDVDAALGRLIIDGSVSAPGFSNPEGVIVYHVAANLYFKRTVERDEEPKSRAAHERPVVATR